MKRGGCSQKETRRGIRGVMIFDVDISSVCAEPLLLEEKEEEDEGAGGGVTCNSWLYIVAIPHSLHHLQLLLPITYQPPTPTPQEAGLNH